jgi:hypothetical protein
MPCCPAGGTRARLRCARPLLCNLAPPRPHLLSACFFVLGVGTLLPWSTSVVTLPWLAAASRRAPAPPPALADSLLGALTLLFSMTNALSVVAVASSGLSQRLPLSWQVTAPLLACAAVCALAAAAARCDAGGTPLAGASCSSSLLSGGGGLGGGGGGGRGGGGGLGGGGLGGGGLGGGGAPLSCRSRCLPPSSKAR